MRIMPAPAKMYKYVGGQIEVQAGDDGKDFPLLSVGKLKPSVFLTPL
jgi:hypothetical protein